jgi:O-methyltransferase domain
MFDHFAKKNLTKRFGGAMGYLGSAENINVNYAVNAYPWDKFSKFVDVGGSRGHFSIALAEKYPEIKFVVEDLPDVVSQGEAVISETLRPRFEFLAHDFFTPQPVNDADVFFMRLILHDWPDMLAIKIIQNLVMAMKPGASIVICENILPEPEENLAQDVEKWSR